MSPPKEGRYTKINAIAAVGGLLLVYVAWQYPKQSRSDQAKPSENSEAYLGTDIGSQHSGEQTGTPESSAAVNFESHRDHSDPSNDATSGGDSVTPENDEKGEGVDLGRAPGFKSPTQACGLPEIATLRPGVSAKVASGLAVLAVKTAREGSEPYLTLSIASDRDTLAEAVLGVPVRYSFATSRGLYFVNVTDADLASGAMTVQVGCEEKGNTP